MFGIGDPVAMKVARVEAVPPRIGRRIEDRPAVQSGLFDGEVPQAWLERLTAVRTEGK